MGWSIAVGKDDIADLSSFGGWSEFQDWTYTLDADDPKLYPLLHFVDHNWYDNCRELLASVEYAKQLVKELGSPDSVPEILEAMATAAKIGKASDAAYLSDGVESAAE